MIAAITLRFLDPFGTKKLVLFQVTYDKVCSYVVLLFLLPNDFQDWHACDLIFFILLGAFGVCLPDSCKNHSLILVEGNLRCLFLQIELSLESSCSQSHMAQGLPSIGSTSSTFGHDYVLFPY